MNRTVNERLTAEQKRLISVIQSERIHQWNDSNDRNEEIKNTAFEKLEKELGKLLHKELETLNERIDDFSKMLLQSSSPTEPEPVPVPDRLRIISRPSLKSSTAGMLENDIFPTGKSDRSMSDLERYFAQQLEKNDKAIQWMNERCDKVKNITNHLKIQNQSMLQFSWDLSSLRLKRDFVKDFIMVVSWAK